MTCAYLVTAGTRAAHDEQLYLTNFRGAEDAEELQRFNITHIVCVNEQSNSHPDKVPLLATRKACALLATPTKPLPCALLPLPSVVELLATR